MSKNSVYRLSAAALIACAVLSVLGGAAHPIHEGQAHTAHTLTQPIFPYAHFAIYLGAILLMVGLPAAAVHLAPRIGRIGLAGLALYFVTNAVAVQGGLTVEGFVVPALAADPSARHLIDETGAITAATWFNNIQMVAGLLFMLSMILLGIGLFRSGVVPRWTGAVLIAGAVFLLVVLPAIPMLPLVTGLLIELPRGLAVAMIGVVMIRSLRPAGTAPAWRLQEGASA
ncbi:hypothetical protein [Actinoplanes sp. NPDC049802]|uniref:hypothetical protein n=1 Tax=Actinoplanes sp. NPDC049802 TaxID=3154742 RepID=UPI003406EC32